MHCFLVRQWMTPLMLVLCGVADFASAQTSSQTWYVQPPMSVEVTTAAASVLQRRFDELRSGFFTSVSTQVKGDAVTVTFKGWVPSPAEVDFLVRRPGRLTISKMGPGAKPFVSTADVVDAQEMPNNTVAIRLSDAGAARMTQGTHGLVGTGLSVELDGKPLAQPRLNEPLGGRFALGMANGPPAKLVSIILRTGPLPAGIMLSTSSGLPTTPSQAKKPAS
jgi:preprotein translocase subunit SecD